MSHNLDDLENAIGHAFADRSLARVALAHPSAAPDEAIPPGGNQRLEFLGDAVLDLVVSEALYQRHPEAREGRLGEMRAACVSGPALATAARRLGLERHLRVGEGERRNNPEPGDAALEDAFEALIGAVFRDGGYAAVRAVVNGVLADELERAPNATAEANPKGRLQEWTQAHRRGATPDYAHLEPGGPDHARSFRAVVRLNGEELGRGEGGSKKAAETEAARDALRRLRISEGAE